MEKGGFIPRTEKTILGKAKFNVDNESDCLVAIYRAKKITFIELQKKLPNQTRKMILKSLKKMIFFGVIEEQYEKRDEWTKVYSIADVSKPFIRNISRRKRRIIK